MNAEVRPAGSTLKVSVFIAERFAPGEGLEILGS
jgi:hypothetical protein